MCIRQAHDRLFSIQEFLKAAIFYFVMIVINECFLFSSLLSLLLECYYFIYLFFWQKVSGLYRTVFFVDGPLLGATLYPRSQYSFVILIPYLLKMIIIVLKEPALSTAEIYPTYSAVNVGKLI